MKTVASDELELLQGNSKSSFYLLILQSGSETLFFCDLPVQSLYADCGVLVEIKKYSSQIAVDDVYVHFASEVIVADANGSLKSRIDEGWFEDCTFELRKVYLADEQSVELSLTSGYVEGVICDNAGSVVLQVKVGRDALAHSYYGILADENVFPHLPVQSSCSVVPAVFGLPQKVKALAVSQPPQAVLQTPLDYGCMEFYVDDASVFPEGEQLLRVGYEWIKGTFSGNKCSVTERGALNCDVTFGRKTGNASIVRIESIINPYPEINIVSKGNMLKGLSLQYVINDMDCQRTILASEPDGIVRLRSPFSSTEEGYVLPEEEDAGKLLSLAQIHDVGEVVSLLGIDYVYALQNVADDGVSIAEGRSGKNYYRLDIDQYEVVYNDTVAFPSCPFALLTLRAPWPVYEMDDEVDQDELFLTVESDTLSGNPVEIISSILESLSSITDGMIDLDRFAESAQACSNCTFSFVLSKQRTVEDLLVDLCRQSRLSMQWANGRLVLRPLENSLGDSQLALTGGSVFQQSVEVSEQAQDVCYITGKYQDGTVYAGDPLAPGQHISMSLWAYKDPAQARQLIEWWLDRLQRKWSVCSVVLADVGQLLDIQDCVSVDIDERNVTGYVGGISLGRENEPEDYNGVRVQLFSPQWAGCSSGCETSCELSACESGCQSTCTVTCELSCQSECMSGLQSLPGYHESCTRSCQVSCRADGESYDCQSTCETGCEATCEGMAFETNCQNGCESYEELYAANDIIVRRAKVSTPSQSVSGEVQLLPLSATGEVHGDEFTAMDFLDINPAADDEVAAVKLADGNWAVASAARVAMFVQVLSDNQDGSYQVVECDYAGNSRGNSFTAYAPAE